MKEVNNEFQCNVPAGTEATITIVFGDGQIGTTFFKIPGGQFVNGEVTNISLGKGSALTGKTMLMTSTITKANPDTSFASITYKLDPGLCEQTYKEKFDDGQDTIRYVTSLKFS
jgi:hypothetical protein